MGTSTGVSFSKHAIKKWQSRAQIMGEDGSVESLHSVFARAVPESPRTKSEKWHIFMRNIIHGPARYLVSDGWRFVVAGSVVVNAERVRPHENFER